MGNANGRADEASDHDDPSVRSADGEYVSSSGNYAPNALPTHPLPPGPVASSDSMANSPPDSPAPFPSPLLFAPQVPVAPLHRNDGHPAFDQMWENESHGLVGLPAERGIPTLITWNYGGSDVAVEGSWDNWTSRQKLQWSGKDHSILLVLPSGIYHYKFIVDDKWRYIPDIPYVADEMGHVCNLLDVHEYVPENLDGVALFEAPASPDSSYTQSFPGKEDFAKEPVVVPPQLHLTVLGDQDSDVQASSSSSSRPRHVVLNHLFIERGWASRSVVALGLTHRFQSKYVTVVLYKPLKR